MAHARGNINIADSKIPNGAMPIILSWFGDHSNEENAKLIQYHDHPLSGEEVNTKRLDSMYRIGRVQNGPKRVEDVSELTDSLAHTSLG